MKTKTDAANILLANGWTFEEVNRALSFHAIPECFNAVPKDRWGLGQSIGTKSAPNEYCVSVRGGNQTLKQFGFIEGA